MVPSAWMMLDSLPLTANGKIDRKALPAPQESMQAEYTPPQGVTEERLAQLWRSLLKRERVGQQDSFFDLGGHSLLATQLLARIRSSFQVELSIRDLFERRTLREQALAIEVHREAGARGVDAPVSELSRQFEQARQALSVAGHALEAGEI
jgi:acyl carrier protein